MNLNFSIDQSIYDQLEFWRNNPRIDQLEAALEALDSMDFIPEFEILDDLQQDAVEGVAGALTECDL